MSLGALALRMRGSNRRWRPVTGSSAKNCSQMRGWHFSKKILPLFNGDKSQIRQCIINIQATPCEAPCLELGLFLDYASSFLNQTTSPAGGRIRWPVRLSLCTALHPPSPKVLRIQGRMTMLLKWLHSELEARRHFYLFIYLFFPVWKLRGGRGLPHSI